MEKENRIYRNILFYSAIVLLLFGVILSFQGKSTNIATYGAAILCLIFSQLSKFESFEGLGIKAKLNQIEESVETIISSSSSDVTEIEKDNITVEELAKELELRRPESESALDTIIMRLKDQKYSFRSNAGLSKNTGMSKNTIESIIMQLYKKGYLNKAHSKSKGVLWTLSDKGKAIIPINYKE